MQGLGFMQFLDPGGKRPLTLQTLPLRDSDCGRRAQKSDPLLRQEHRLKLIRPQRARTEDQVSRFLLRLRRRLFEHRMAAQMINLFT